MIRFAGITEIFRLIFRQCGSFSMQSFSPQLSRSTSASCSLGWTMAASDWRNSNNGLQSQVQTDGFSHSFTYQALSMPSALAFMKLLAASLWSKWCHRHHPCDTISIRLQQWSDLICHEDAPSYIANSLRVSVHSSVAAVRGLSRSIGAAHWE